MDTQVPKYRYLIARVSDGAFVMEVPFSGVSWERKINAAGSFSGSIAIPGNSALDGPRLSSSEDHFDLYNSTLPGKNAIYIMRNDQIVWGGIIWSRDYDIRTKVINVTAAEFVSYLYHRVFWKTFVLPELTTSVKSMLNTFITYVNNDQDTINSTYAASDTHNLMTYYAHSGTTVTFTTEEKHGFRVGTKIKIGNHNNALHSNAVATPYNYDGDNLTVASVPNSRQFTITSLITASPTITTTAYAVNSGVYCIKQSSYDSIQSASAVNLTTNNGLSIDNALNDYKIIGSGDNNPFEFRGHRMTYVGEIIENFAKNGVPAYTQATVAGTDYPRATVGGSNIRRVVKKQTVSNVATLTTSTAHGFSIGNSVTVANVDSVFNGTYTITAPITSNTFSYAKTISPNVPETLVGADLVSVRFDFTVESNYDANTKTFYNFFKAWLVQKDINNPAGNITDGASLTNLYGPSNLGANQYIFEHPGNIVSLTLNESAERSASRTWVVDNKNDLGDAATPFYGSYTNLPYLNNLFPLLEVAITDRDLPTDNDADVVPFAQELGYRLAPPVGDYKIVVNGSFDPQVGSYQPGDWCGIIPHDEFINNRLRLPYENRNDILIRKIGSFKVNVPDNPSFPETVELELLVEWEVTE
jgi:hypothetical protein